MISTLLAQKVSDERWHSGRSFKAAAGVLSFHCSTALLIGRTIKRCARQKKLEN
jgi:hypothetical protein